MKTNLNDVTFIIPVRVDSVIRLENLILAVEHLKRYLDCCIMVLEADSYNNGFIKKVLGNKIEYYFIEDSDHIFYRTRYLNIMTKKVVTPFLAIWDTDVIVPPAQIIESANKLRNESYDIALPYDGRALETSEIIREIFVKKPTIAFLEKQQYKMNLLHKTAALRGAAILVNADSYKKAGMENTAFYGWGSEDFDRFDRWKILGYKIHLVKGVLYHLTHPRGDNSKFSKVNRFVNSETALFQTRVSSAEEIYNRIKYQESE